MSHIRVKSMHVILTLLLYLFFLVGVRIFHYSRSMLEFPNFSPSTLKFGCFYSNQVFCCAVAHDVRLWVVFEYRIAASCSSRAMLQQPSAAVKWVHSWLLFSHSQLLWPVTYLIFMVTLYSLILNGFAFQ